MTRQLANIQINRPSSARQQVASQLRKMILSGEAKEGYKLPSTKELSAQWGVAHSSVHAALTTLTKEGLLERTRKLGTFVAKRSNALTCVGIYLWRDIWRSPNAAYSRTLVSLFGELLAERGIQADVWIDPRARDERKAAWPELVRAADERRIQALLLPNTSHIERPWISRLAVPFVELTQQSSTSNRVTMVPCSPERLAVEELARMGCRTVGMISPMNPTHHTDDSGDQESLQGEKVFRAKAAELGMGVDDSWLLHPDNTPNLSVLERSSERFGYESMMHLLGLPNRPEGVYVQHDWVTRGALTAILQKRIAVPEELKLVLYRNTEIDLLCPVPAAFVEVSIKNTALAMIEMLLAQLRGEEIVPVMVTPTITSAEAAQTVFKESDAD
ncbi:MAG: substrate-binding domain-containing protein [Phycisphaerae bacterium]